MPGLGGVPFSDPSALWLRPQVTEIDENASFPTPSLPSHVIRPDGFQGSSSSTPSVGLPFSPLNKALQGISSCRVQQFDLPQ